MNKRIKWWLLPLGIILSACPFESTVPLETRPVEPVDSSLIGFWYGIIRDGSDYFGIEALEVERKTDSLYSIIRYGKGIKGDLILPDTGYFTGFTSWIGDQQFMNLEGTVTIEEVKGKNNREFKKHRVFYLSAFERRGDTLDVKTVTENFTTKKIFNTPAEFKQLLIKMMAEKKNIYDEQYSLKYKKIPKPLQIYPSN